MDADTIDSALDAVRFVLEQGAERVSLEHHATNPLNGGPVTLRVVIGGRDHAAVTTARTLGISPADSNPLIEDVRAWIARTL